MTYFQNTDSTLQTDSSGALWKTDPRGFSISAAHFVVDLSIEPDQAIKKLVDSYISKMNSHMDEVIAHTDEELDGRFLQVGSFFYYLFKPSTQWGPAFVVHDFPWPA